MTGLELKLKRIEAGLTQYRVAAALDIPPATLSYYENGHRPLPPGMEDRILAVIEARGKQGAERRQRLARRWMPVLNAGSNFARRRSEHGR